MAKCTGVRCPMQYGYKVEECNHTDCPYRTEPITNADRIRAMSDEELAKFMNLCGHDFPPYCDVESSISGECDQNCIKCAEEWLKQPTE